MSDQQNPTEALADIIAAALTENGLLPKARAGEFRERLASGKVREEDWRLYAELALDEAGESSR